MRENGHDSRVGETPPVLLYVPRPRRGNRRLGIPLGSGVTEAACKTVYTQRLKLSGMRWQKAGAQTILTLRVILLSGVWEQVYEQTLEADCDVRVRPPDQLRPPAAKKAA